MNDNMIKKVTVIANNVLYFDDSSDYGTALYQILSVVAPDIDLDELEYIEEKE